MTLIASVPGLSFLIYKQNYAPQDCCSYKKLGFNYEAMWGQSVLVHETPAIELFA